MAVLNFCPIIKKTCVEFDCMWWMQLQGVNPQTGAHEDYWGCAINLIPQILVESSKETRQAAAAIESFRNEMVKANDQLLSQTTPFLKDTSE